MFKLSICAVVGVLAATGSFAETVHVHFALNGRATHSVFPQNDDDLSSDNPAAQFQIKGDFDIDTARLYSEHVFVDDRPGYVQLLDPSKFSGTISGRTVDFLGIQVAFDPRQLSGEGLTFCGWTDSAYTQLCGANGSSNSGTFSWSQNFSTAEFTAAPDVNGWMSGFYTGATPAAGTFSFTLSRPFTFGEQSDVPEPAAWITAVAGFGLIGAALRRRKPLAQCRATGFM